jgi:hypothetical protein
MQIVFRDDRNNSSPMTVVSQFSSGHAYRRNPGTTAGTSAWQTLIHTRPSWDKFVLSIRLDRAQLSNEMVMVMILLRHQRSIGANENFS